jgi:hypothetical protein
MHIQAILAHNTDLQSWHIMLSSKFQIHRFDQDYGHCTYANGQSCRVLNFKFVDERQQEYTLINPFVPVKKITRQNRLCKSSLFQCKSSVFVPV